MPSEDRFPQAVITTISKRAANRCSNPDCNAITSGPALGEAGSVNVGEAAHIYGANFGSARFDADMSSVARRAISNAIWLCGNCHKLVDDDPVRYPAGLLFEWQRQHEYAIAKLVGKAGADVRKRYEDRHLEEFGRLSYLAERLIIEKDDLWEYRLTAEVLRFEMAPILRRWNALKHGLYVKAYAEVERDVFVSWMLSKNKELTAISGAFCALINGEFAQAWGANGVPGDDSAIVATCRLYAEVCESAIQWEEAVRFVQADECFEEIMNLYVGAAGGIIDEASKLPEFLSMTFSNVDVTGRHELNLVLTLPDGWAVAFDKAWRRVEKVLRR
jgi:hypothetical protein